MQVQSTNGLGLRWSDLIWPANLQAQICKFELLENHWRAATVCLTSNCVSLSWLNFANLPSLPYPQVLKFEGLGLTHYLTLHSHLLCFATSWHSKVTARHCFGSASALLSAGLEIWGMPLKLVWNCIWKFATNCLHILRFKVWRVSLVWISFLQNCIHLCRSWDLKFDMFLN